LRIGIPSVKNESQYQAVLGELGKALNDSADSSDVVVEIHDTNILTLSLAAILFHMRQELLLCGRQLKIVAIPKSRNKGKYPVMGG